MHGRNVFDYLSSKPTGFVPARIYLFMIPTRRRLEHARGYLELGMVPEAVDELEAIDETDRQATEVLEVRVDICMQTKQWDKVVCFAKPVAEAKPEVEQIWIHWAFALRELQRIEEARDVLLKAEPLHGETSSVLHYNLACYYCLLGELDEARRRLAFARAKEDEWREHALSDTDLKALWGELRASD